MSTPKPTLRRVGVTIERDDGKGVEATLDLIDYGGDRHHGQLWINGASVPATLSGANFKPHKRGGRPTREARDVAVWLARAWFAREGRSKVAQQVVDAWAKAGHSGISESTHVYAACKRADAAFGIAPDSAVLANDGGAAWIALAPRESDALVFESPAWIWNLGDETATFGVLTGRADRII